MRCWRRKRIESTNCSSGVCRPGYQWFNGFVSPFLTCINWHMGMGYPSDDKSVQYSLDPLHPVLRPFQPPWRAAGLTEQLGYSYSLWHQGRLARPVRASVTEYEC